MGMKSLRSALWAGLAAIAMATSGCGGGGGGGGGGGFALPAAWGGGSSPSTPAPVSGGGTATPTPTPATATATLDVLGGSGASTTSISALEIGQGVAVIKDAKGQPASGVIVKFAETGGSLLTISPAAATALTDGSGRAVVEVRAASTTSLGATTLTATATVGGATVTGQKSIAVTSAPTTSTTDPQAMAAALNFLDANPADKSIVIKGAGGNGRSESATLRFRVVDKNNSPLQGVVVNFSVNPEVTLNIVSATSDSDGVVLTTVSSGTTATVAIVVATVNGRSISTQSDQLTVTTGTATQAGFDLAATKYNLDSRFSGDKSTITVRIVDANGNPVADGVPVVFTSDFLAVGSSSRGGCVTSGGACSVDLVVQDPRPADGQYVTVTASTRVGSSTPISKSVQFTADDVARIALYDGPSSGATQIGALSLGSGKCGVAQVVSLFAGTPSAFPAPSGSSVTVRSSSTDLAVALNSPATIDDLVAIPRQRSRVDLQFTPSASACAAGTAFVDVTFTSPNGVKQVSTLTITTVP